MPALSRPAEAPGGWGAPGGSAVGAVAVWNRALWRVGARDKSEIVLSVNKTTLFAAGRYVLEEA